MFRTVSVEADGGRAHAEAVYASCRRGSCPMFDMARLVHWEGPIATESAARAPQLFVPADLLRP